MSNIPRIYMDSCCIIDMVAIDLSFPRSEDTKTKVWYCKKFFEASKAGDIKLCTSALTINECLYVRENENNKDSKIFDDKVINLFRSILESGNSGIYPIEVDIFIRERARELYWNYDIFLPPMDSLHIATALEYNCIGFLTSDKDIIRYADKINDLGLKIENPKGTSLLPENYRQTNFTEKL